MNDIEKTPIWVRFASALQTVPRQTWFGIAIVIGLWWIFMSYTRWPAVQQKSEILTVLASGAPNTFSELMSREGWSYWLSWIPTGVNMNDNNAIGMAFAFLIGGAVTSLILPAGFVRKLLHSKGFVGASYGGLLGAPLMMCSACSVPVAIGWKNRGANIETTLGVVMGASLLNVMGLMTIFVLFPAPAAWGRILASVLMVVALTPMVVKVSGTISEISTRMPSGYLKEKAEQVREELFNIEGVPAGKEPWIDAATSALKTWWQNSVAIAYRLFLPMTGAVFLAAFIRLFLPPEIVETYMGGGWIAIVLMAAFGTLIAIPTLFEIPLVMGFMFIGMGLGPAAALLVTAPSVSVVSYFMLKKDTGHVPPLLLMVVTFLLGAVTGLIVEYGVSHVG